MKFNIKNTLQAPICFLDTFVLRVSKKILVFAFFLFYTIGVYPFHQKDSIDCATTKFFIEEGTAISGIDKEQIVIVRRESKKTLNAIIYVSQETVFVGIENIVTNGVTAYIGKNSNQVKVKFVNNIQKAITKKTRVSIPTEVKRSDAPYNTPFSLGKYSSVLGFLPSSNSTFVFLSACLIKEIISEIKLLKYKNYALKIQNRDFLNSYLLVVKFTTRPPPSLS